MNLIDEEYTKHPFKGKRQMRDFLVDQGCDIGVKRTRTLMRLMGLESVAPKPDLSKPHPHHPKFPYMLKGLEIKAPDDVWASDITYIRLGKGFVYLAAVMDWYSRYVLSWELSTSLENEFCVRCLESALILHENEGTSGNIQHGSRGSVHEFELRGGASRTFDSDQHGRQGAGVRQHHDRAFVADVEVRGSLFEIVRRRP